MRERKETVPAEQALMGCTNPPFIRVDAVSDWPLDSDQAHGSYHSEKVINLPQVATASLDSAHAWGPKYRRLAGRQKQNSKESLRKRAEKWVRKPHPSDPTI